MATFTNQAQLSYNNAVVNSNVAVGEIVEVLSAAKTSVGRTYSSGDSVTYIVSIVNSGSTQYTGLTVTDNMGEYTVNTNSVYPLSYEAGSVAYYVNGVLQTAPAVAYTDSNMVISGITVPAGGNAILVYKAQVNEFAPLLEGSAIENMVTIAGAGITPITADNQVTVVSEPILGITKSVSPVPVSESGILTYTFLLQNSGNVEADGTDNVTITDTFDPILGNLTVTFNGTAWAEGTNYTYDQDTGAFATIAGQVTVPAATYAQDTATGAWTVTPGISTLTVSGTV